MLWSLRVEFQLRLSKTDVTNKKISWEGNHLIIIRPYLWSWTYTLPPPPVLRWTCRGEHSTKEFQFLSTEKLSLWHLWWLAIQSIISRHIVACIIWHLLNYEGNISIFIPGTSPRRLWHNAWKQTSFYMPKPIASVDKLTGNKLHPNLILL